MGVTGYWKFYRSMLDHAVWSLPGDQLKVWLTICSKVNRTEMEWFDGKNRVIIPPGSYVTSQDHLAAAAKVGRQTVRTAIKNLSRLESISTNVLTKRYTIITVTNWSSYSGLDSQANQEANQPLTKSQPRANQELTIIREGREGREGREELHCEAGASRNGHEARDVLAFLNRKAGRNYRPSDTNLDFIRARLKSGIHSWQLKAIVSRKVKEWAGTDQDHYLRPATLFNKTKCEQYLGELPKESGDALPGV